MIRLGKTTGMDGEGLKRPREPHHGPGFLVFRFQDGRVKDLQEQLQTSR